MGDAFSFESYSILTLSSCKVWFDTRVVLVYFNVNKFYNFALILSGGGTGPMNPGNRISGLRCQFLRGGSSPGDERFFLRPQS